MLVRFCSLPSCSAKGLLNDMINEEEALRQRIKSNIVTTQKQLETLCAELSVEPYKVGLAGCLRYCQSV